MTIDPGKGPNMTQRAVMQHLSLTDWKLAGRLPIPAGELTMSRLVLNGWIEIQGEDHNTVAKLTAAGLKAMRSRILSHPPACRARAEGEMKWSQALQELLLTARCAVRDLLLILGTPFALGCVVGWACRALVSKRRRRLDQQYYFKPPASRLD